MNIMSAHCGYVYKSGRHAGEHCEIRPTNGERFCYKHKKAAEKRSVRVHESDALGSDSVFAAPGATREPAKAAPKRRFSNWMITINSNQDYSKMSADEKKLFKDFIDYTFDRNNIVKFLTDTTSGNHDNIVNLMVEHYFEVGPINGRLHMHGLLSVEHTGNFRLEFNRIRDAARRILGRTIHLSAPVSGDQSKAYAQYAQKKATMGPDII